MHEPEPMLENDKCKILWDFANSTDKEIEHQRPDIVVIDKEKREYKITFQYIAVPGDQNIDEKELSSSGGSLAFQRVGTLRYQSIFLKT